MTFHDNFCFVLNHPSTSHILSFNAGSRIFWVRLDLGVSGRVPKLQLLQDSQISLRLTQSILPQNAQNFSLYYYTVGFTYGTLYLQIICNTQDCP